MYIVFVNKNNCEKLAINSNCTSCYKVEDILLYVDKICEINNFRFTFKSDVSKRTPIIDLASFYKITSKLKG